MSKTHRTYTREFKLEVIRGHEHGKTVAELCRIYEISPTNINRWKSELQANPEHAFSGNGNPYKENAKIAEYERLLGQAQAGHVRPWNDIHIPAKRGMSGGGSKRVPAVAGGL